MWAYGNPVPVRFGAGSIAGLADLIGGRRYAVVTYPDCVFADHVARLASQTEPPALVVDDVAPNPDIRHLGPQCARFLALGRPVEVIVALGGGSVIDTAKVLAAAGGDMARVTRYLETGTGGAALSATPIIAVPTTAGTGSEVTCWATVWDGAAGRKHSLARPTLYPEAAIVDPALMLGKPRGLTLATGLDALSHALESLWNINANPVSATFAVAAATRLRRALPPLLSDLGNLSLRSEVAEASLMAGLAFSNTKTAIAHNISYPITLERGVPHGVACSFTLPRVLRSVIGLGGFREEALKAIFGADLAAGADNLERFLDDLGVSSNPADHGIPPERWRAIVEAAFAGERGKNFTGSVSCFLGA